MQSVQGLGLIEFRVHGVKGLVIRSRVHRA